MSEKKLCPILVAADRENRGNNGCLGEMCAVFLKIHKPNVLTYGNVSYCEPEEYLRFEGCGLVQHVPWERVKLERVGAR
jgi:hypothetical protein